MKKRKSNKQKTDPRVIAGKIKGKKIECPPGIIRPMTSRVREALFNIIGDCSSLKMLDLFCGSGSISIEAFSRGLENADLVEGDHGKKAVILKNLENAGFHQANLMIADAIQFCQNCHQQYDFIMTDPPFSWTKKEELLKIISQKKILKDDGILIIHLQKNENLSVEIDQLIRYDIRSYGLNTLLFYKHQKDV